MFFLLIVKEVFLRDDGSKSSPHFSYVRVHSLIHSFTDACIHSLICLRAGSALDWRSIKTAEKFIRWDREEERNRLIYGGADTPSYDPTDSEPESGEDEDDGDE